MLLAKTSQSSMIYLANQLILHVCLPVDFKADCSSMHTDPQNVIIDLACISSLTFGTEG